jgi:DeoR/GlpR family transcriptional regulator of sugar metabolism
MILSCTAVTNKDIFENSLEQKELKLAALKRSKTKLLLFDHNKYTAHATYRLGSLSDFDIVVNDLECANIHSKTND